VGDAVVAGEVRLEIGRSRQSTWPNATRAFVSKLGCMARGGLFPLSCCLRRERRCLSHLRGPTRVAFRSIYSRHIFAACDFQASSAIDFTPRHGEKASR